MLQVPDIHRRSMSTDPLLETWRDLAGPDLLFNEVKSLAIGIRRSRQGLVY